MPPSDRGPHEADLALWNAATVILKRRREELVADAGRRVGVPGYAYLYAQAVLAADDHDGRRLGWVTRADLVRWDDLLIVARAAAGRLDRAHTGQDLPGCAGCDLHRAIGRLRTTSARRTAPPPRRAGAADVGVAPFGRIRTRRGRRTYPRVSAAAGPPREWAWHPA